MSWIHDELRNTFPIPARELRRRRWRIAFGRPATWLAPIALATLGGLLGGPPAAAAGAALGAGASALVWKRRADALDATIAGQIVRDSNLAQDSALMTLVTRLRRHGYGSYAATVGSFAALKTKIEGALERAPDGAAGSAAQSVGKLVDDLVFNVVDQLEAMAKIEYRLRGREIPSPPQRRAAELRTAWREMAGRVRRAHRALQDTWANLDLILEPLASDHAGERLDDTIDALHEENRLAEEVRTRMLADAAARTSLPTESARAEAEIASAFHLDPPPTSAGEAERNA